MRKPLLLSVNVVAMALFSSQSHFAWLCKLPYWAGSGLSVFCWLLSPITPVFAASGSSQLFETVPETFLADDDPEEQSQPPPPEADTPAGDIEGTTEPEPGTLGDFDVDELREGGSSPAPELDNPATSPQTDREDTPSTETNPGEQPLPTTKPPLEDSIPIEVDPSNIDSGIDEDDTERLDQQQPAIFSGSGIPECKNLSNEGFSGTGFDTYRLGPGDSFFVSVSQFPDLSFQATLDIQGNVIVPLHGIESFNGKAIQEVKERIQVIYSRYVEDPQTRQPVEVGVTLVAQRGVEVTVLGEVVRPGFYPLGAPQLSTALLSAGGTTGNADLREVLIQRQLFDGDDPINCRIDLFTPLLMETGQELPDVALQDGDVITVRRLDPAVLDEYDRDLVARSTLARPNITVRVLNYGGGSLGGTTGGNLTAIELPNGSRFADALVRIGLNPDTSNLKEIGLVRFDEEAGQAVTLTLDGNEAFRGDPSENPPLYNNDVVIVNRTLLARITYAFNVFTQPFRDVLGFILFFDSLAESADNLFAP